RGLNNVRFLTPVPKQDVQKIRAAADACLFTLADVKTFDYGVSPNKLFEYMAAGKPILCAASGEVARLIEDHAMGLVSKPEDGTALAENAVKMARMSPEKLSQMGNMAKKVFERSYSPH